MKKVTAVGNALVDILIKIENDTLLKKFNLPKGSMQLVDSERSDSIISQLGEYDKVMVAGGSSANTINSLAKLGVETSYVGKIGEDDFGVFFEKDMRNNGVVPTLLKTKTKTGRAVALISEDGERTFATSLGAAVEFDSKDFNLSQFKGFYIVHFEGYLVFNQSLIENLLKLAKEANCLISMDMASYNVIDAFPDFMKYIVEEYVDIAFFNEEEAKSFTGEEPEKALNIISEMCDIAIVKIGKDGSLIKRNTETVKVGAISAKPIDTTGAGDNYAAGFIYGLINNYSLETSAKIGSLLGGKVIEVLGAKMPERIWLEIQNELKNII